MKRAAALALAVLAVLSLAFAAASVETVSTDPTVDTDAELEPKYGGGRGGGGGGNDTRQQTQERSTVVTERTTEPGADSADPPLSQVVAVAGVVVFGGVVALYLLTGGDGPAEGAGGRDSPTEPTAPAPDSVTLGDDVPPTNDVYRAWCALSDGVCAPAGETTPADVARAAVEAGYPSDAVTDLTETFCAIRYGDAAPTERRERRARELAATLGLETEGGP